MLHSHSALTPRAAFFILIFSLVVFAALAATAPFGAFDELERAFMTSLRAGEGLGEPLGPAWLGEFALEVTTLGGWPLLTLLSALLLGVFLLRGQGDFVGVLLAVVIGHAILVRALKALFERERPDFLEHLAHATHSSFPSGHSASAAAVYLTLGLMLANISERRSFRLYAIGGAIMVASLIGLSRIYLGVHYPTDVIAGWAVGSAWASLVWIIAWRMTR